MLAINVDYSGAIQFYQAQKQQFLHYYNLLRQEETSMSSKDFLAKVSEELNSESLQEEYKMASDLLNNLGARLTDRATLKTYRAYAETQMTNNKIQGDALINQIMHEIIDDVELSTIVKDSIARYGNGFCGKDILDHSRGYIRALIQQRIINRGTHNPKVASRASKMKGYYREGLVYKALSEVFKSLENNPLIEIKPQGASHTAIDTLIEFNQLAINKKIGIDIGENINFGVQVKSWKDPWSMEGQYQSIGKKSAVIYSVGSRTDLLNQLDNKKSWIAGVNFLGQTSTIKSAIGENNILYITGNGAYFTGDLINQMRQNAYYLAFVFSPEKYEATASITWQQRMSHIKWIQSMKRRKT